MNTFVIAGGNSGVGLQAARDLLGAGHRVVLLGRGLPPRSRGQNKNGGRHPMGRMDNLNASDRSDGSVCNAA